MILFLLACSSSSKDDPTSYVVFEEAAPRTFVQLAFTADNTPIVLVTGGTLDRLEPDGSSVPLEVPGGVRSIASLPSGDVILAHDFGYATTDGSTVTPADDLGLPPMEELAIGGLQAGPDHVWALGVVGLAQGVDVYRSDGGDADAFEIVNRIDYSGTFLDPDARIELRATPDDVVEVWYSTSLDTLTSISTDLGSSFSDADRPAIQARRRTSDGLLVGTGSAEVMWKGPSLGKPKSGIPSRRWASSITTAAFSSGSWTEKTSCGAASERRPIVQNTASRPTTRDARLPSRVRIVT